jgi:hypothetical protein
MTVEEKAATFDLLRVTRVIKVRKGPRYIDGKQTQATWVERGENENQVVDDYVTTLEAEASKQPA